MTNEIFDVYLRSSPDQCLQIRQLIANFKGILYFLGASTPLDSIKTKNDGPKFLRRLVAESICDQWPDSRDLILRLNDYYDIAIKAGIDIDGYVDEVRKLSSPINIWGFGSMQQLLDRLKPTQPLNQNHNHND